jgi:hypothetical protein
MKTLVDYQGRRIRLTAERLQHILQHPEMANMEQELEQTLSNPERVVQSNSDETARLYYRFQTGTQFGDKWLCVVVKYTDEPFVLTAYLTDAIKRGAELWRKK